VFKTASLSALGCFYYLLCSYKYACDVLRLEVRLPKYDSNDRLRLQGLELLPFMLYIQSILEGSPLLVELMQGGVTLVSYQCQRQEVSQADRQCGFHPVFICGHFPYNKWQGQNVCRMLSTSMTRYPILQSLTCTASDGVGRLNNQDSVAGHFHPFTVFTYSLCLNTQLH